MGTIIGEYIGTTIGIHSPIPYKAPDSFAGGIGAVCLHVFTAAGSELPGEADTDKKYMGAFRKARYSRYPKMGVSENRGPYYSTLNCRILIIRTPK